MNKVYEGNADLVGRYVSTEGCGDHGPADIYVTGEKVFIYTTCCGVIDYWLDIKKNRRIIYSYVADIIKRFSVKNEDMI